MAVKSVILQRSTQKQLAKLPLHVHQKIIFALKRIKENPLTGIKLHGQLASYHKLRVGDYRIVYQFNQKENIVVIVKIEHRQGVYK